MTDMILLWGCLQLNILITYSPFAWFLVMKLICNDGGEFHIICQEGEDLLVKEQYLITYILLVICLISFMQESVDSHWLCESASEILASWVFEPIGIKDRPWTMLNSLTHCLPARKYLAASWSSLGNILTFFCAQCRSPTFFLVFQLSLRLV